VGDLRTTEKLKLWLISNPGITELVSRVTLKLGDAIEVGLTPGVEVTEDSG
jgi:hypothetical protein